jgi:hypothetical protein
MTQEENKLQIIEDGLVGFFDILGFKAILQANGVEESIDIVNTCMFEATVFAEKTFKSRFEVRSLIFSDSILVALPNSKDSAGVLVFTCFCQQLFSGLLVHGLPARGAISRGRFAIQTQSDQIVFVGQPIVESHELAASLEIAACALTPSSESSVLSVPTRNIFQTHKTPLKNLPSRELNLLKFGTEFSCAEITQYFQAHKKKIDICSTKKLNNTIEFLKACKELRPD